MDALVERAAGSPLFAQTVTELVRRSHRPGLPLPDVPLPDQLLPFLTSRLDALGDGAQATALRMAVLGRPVRAAGLAQVFALNPEDVERDLALLAGSAIARPSADGHATLRHDSVGRALLGRASHADRAPLHARSAAIWWTRARPPVTSRRTWSTANCPSLEPRIFRWRAGRGTGGVAAQGGASLGRARPHRDRPMRRPARAGRAGAAARPPRRAQERLARSDDAGGHGG